MRDSKEMDEIKEAFEKAAKCIYCDQTGPASVIVQMVGSPRYTKATGIIKIRFKIESNSEDFDLNLVFDGWRLNNFKGNKTFENWGDHRELGDETLEKTLVKRFKENIENTSLPPLSNNTKMRKISK